MKTVAAIFLMLLAAPLAACCMVPRSYDGDVDQSAQQGVIIHRAPTEDAPGYEELMLRVAPFFHESDDNPEYLAWVLTVPSKPLRYDVAEKSGLRAGPELHEKLYALAREQWDARTRFELPDFIPTLSAPAQPKGAANPALEVQPEVTVGPYAITPVKATGKDAVAALNEYLVENDFPQEPPAHLRYFIENDFTFLCIRITPPQGDSALGRRIDLAPLVVGFETDSPYYPAKFSSRQGNFALDLTLITDTPLRSIPLEYTRMRLNAERRAYVHLLNLWSVKPLPDALQNAYSERATEPPEMWYVNRIESFGFNETIDGEPAIAGWEEDVFFELGDYNDAVAGFWYYGDSDISMPERLFREHALALMMLGGLTLFGTLFIKTRINRKRLRQAPAKETTAD